MLAVLLKKLLSRAAARPWPEPAARAGELNRDGLARFAAGGFIAAEQSFRAALALSPSDPFYACHLASALCAQGRLAEAGPYALAGWRGAMDNANHVECLKYIVMNIEADEGTDFLALIGAGNRLRRMGDFAGAETAYRSALGAPDAAAPFAENRIGALLCCMGRYAESTPYFAAGTRAHMMLDRITDFSPDLLNALTAQGATFAADLPAMALETPDASADQAGPVLLMSCDSTYFEKFAFALAHSVSRNAAAACALHFHVVNPDARVATGIAGMRAQFPALPIALSSEHCEVAGHMQPKAYYACARFLRLGRLLRHYRRPVMVLDMDLLVARGLAPLLTRLRESDVAIPLVSAGRGEPGEILWAACVWFAFSQRGLQAADLVGAYIRHFIGRGTLLWFLDQIALLALVAQVAQARQGTDGVDVMATRLLLLPETLIQNGAANTAAPAAPATTEQDLDAVFWTMSHSVAGNAALMDSAEFRRYASTKPT